MHIACFPWEEFEGTLLGFFVKGTDIAELDLQGHGEEEMERVRSKKQ